MKVSEILQNALGEPDKPLTYAQLVLAAQRLGLSPHELEDDA